MRHLAWTATSDVLFIRNTCEMPPLGWVKLLGGFISELLSSSHVVMSCGPCCPLWVGKSRVPPEQRQAAIVLAHVLSLIDSLIFILQHRLAKSRFPYPTVPECSISETRGSNTVLPILNAAEPVCALLSRGYLLWWIFVSCARWIFYLKEDAAC